VVKIIASIDKSAGKPICTENAAPQGVDTGMCLMNSSSDNKDTKSSEKNDEIFKIFIPESRAPPQASLFE